MGTNLSGFCRRGLLLAGLMALICGCVVPGPSRQDASRAHAPQKRTIVLYMEMNNDLVAAGLANLEDIFSSEVGEDLHVVAYVDVPPNISPGHPVLYRITPDEQGKRNTIDRVWGPNTGTDPLVFRQVLSEIRSRFPADEYGLVYWSHGTGWLSPVNAPSRAVGLANGTSMSLQDFAAFLPGDWTFIAFDACYMGTIEAAYELRKKTSNLLFSPAEILSFGFPYREVLPLLGVADIDYKAVVQAVVEAYRLQPIDLYQTVAISWASTDAVDELASLCQTISRSRGGGVPWSSGESALQSYSASSLASAFVDLGDLWRLSALTGKIQSSEADQLEAALLKVVKAKETTGFIPGPLELESFSGLAIADYGNLTEADKTAYRDLAWYRACYE